MTGTTRHRLRLIHLLWLVFPLVAQADFSHPQLQLRLEAYVRTFPKIAFVHLPGPEGIDSLLAVAQRLGHNAYDAVYEHPDDVRNLLLEAQLSRIALMLKNNVPSATLLHVGDNAELKEPFVCVLTLNERHFSSHNAGAATRLLIGGLEFLRTGSVTQLSNMTFLRFTLEHELFHCLDAYLNGPTIRRTETEVAGRYEFFRAEQRADLYAAMSLRRAGCDARAFLAALADMRTLSFLDWDHAHYTAPILHDAMELPVIDRASVSLEDFALQISRLADQRVMSQEGFVRLLSAAHYVALSRGVKAAAIAPEAPELRKRQKDEALIAILETAIAMAQNSVFGPDN